MDSTRSYYFPPLLDELDSGSEAASVYDTETSVLTRDLIIRGKTADETGTAVSAPVSLDFDLESGSALLFTPRTTFDPSELIIRKPQIDPEDVPAPSKPPSRLHPFIPVTQISVKFLQTPFVVPMEDGDGMEELDWSDIGYSEIEKNVTMASSEHAPCTATASHAAKPVSRGPPSSFTDALLSSYGLWNLSGHLASYPALRAALAVSTPRTVDKRVADAVNMLIPRPPPPPVQPVVSRMKVPVPKKPVMKETAKHPVLTGITFKVVGAAVPKSQPKKRKLDQVLTGPAPKKPKVVVVRSGAGKKTVGNSSSIIGLPEPSLHVSLPPIEFPESLAKATEMLPLLDNGKRIIIHSRNSIPEPRKERVGKNKEARVRLKTTKKRRMPKKVLKVLKNVAEKKAQPAQQPKAQQNLSMGKNVEVTSYQPEQRPHRVVVQSKVQTKQKKTVLSPGVFSKDEWEMMALVANS